MCFMDCLTLCEPLSESVSKGCQQNSSCTHSGSFATTAVSSCVVYSLVHVSFLNLCLNAGLWVWRFNAALFALLISALVDSIARDTLKKRLLWHLTISKEPPLIICHCHILSNFTARNIRKSTPRRGRGWGFWGWGEGVRRGETEGKRDTDLATNLSLWAHLVLNRVGDIRERKMKTNTYIIYSRYIFFIYSLYTAFHKHF